MRVLQVIDGLRSGGAEGFIANLGVSLSELGSEVRFFLTSGVRGERGEALLRRLQQAGVEVYGREERKAGSLANFLELVELVRTWHPDIVQANLYSAEVLSAATAAVTRGKKTQYVHRLADTNIQAHRSPWILRRLDRCFATTIACSPAVAEAYSKFMGRHQRSRVVSIPNGGVLLDDLPSPSAREQARSELGIPANAFVAVHIGRMSSGANEGASRLQTAQKAHDVLIEAFADAFGHDHDCLLLCVGDGPLRPELEQLAAEIGVSDNVRFLGTLPEPWPALKAADVFVFPSRHEGLPNVLPEAASCGLPVIASDITENAFLYPGDAWTLAPVDDVGAFAEALRVVRAGSSAYSLRARELAPSFKDRFSMRTCAAAYLECYRDTLGRRGEHAVEHV